MNKIELSSFSWVKPKKKTSVGRMLRFTLTWLAGHDTDPYAISLVGCLAYKRGPRQELSWAPPKNNYQFGGSALSILVNNRLYDDVLKIIADSKFYNEIGDDILDFLKQEEVSPDSPKSLNLNG